MALSDDELQILNRLHGRLEVDIRGEVVPRDRGGRRELGFHVLERYYDGQQRLRQLGLAVPEELRRFVTVVAWPSVVVDAVEQRLDVEGFRLPGSDDADEEIWRVWQANDLDTESHMGHVDAKVFRRAYTCVGTNEDDPGTPLVTVESPLEMTHSLDPRTRQVDAAARFFVDQESLVRFGEKYATLYLPNVTIQLSMSGGAWTEDDRDEHGLDEVPVSVLLNRPRLKRRRGESEMLRSIPLTDAAARALTNAQVATELLAVPQRWALGMMKDDFVDPKTNEQVPTWEAYFGAIWGSTNPEAKFGQFAAADLRNFEVVVDLYAKHVAGLYGLPMRYFGQNTINPPSADGIMADESRLIKRAERDQRVLDAGWERTVRLWTRFQNDGAPADKKLDQLETLWRDPATPTRAEQADAAVKLVAAGILPVEAAWVDLGYSATRRAQLRAMREAEQTDALTKALLNPPQPPTAGGGAPAGGQPGQGEPAPGGQVPPQMAGAPGAAGS